MTKQITNTNNNKMTYPTRELCDSLVDQGLFVKASKEELSKCVEKWPDTYQLDNWGRRRVKVWTLEHTWTATFKRWFS